MLLVIAIVVIAAIIAVLLKKSKASNVSKKLESKAEAKTYNPIKKAEAPVAESAVSFVRSSATYGTTGLACAGSPSSPIYQSSFYGTTPTSGAQLYTDQTLTKFWNNAKPSGYYLIQTQGVIKYAVSMNSNGTIASVVAC